jgi:hypothetical protein
MGNYGGNGFGYVYLEFGIFVVKHNNVETKFPTLSAAREFYDMIDAPKAIWDCTKLPELLDAEI